MAKSKPKKKAPVTSKGRITVPHEVRRALGVRLGGKFLFERDGSKFRVKPLRAESPIEKYRGIGNPAIPSGRKAIIRAIRQLRGR